MNASVSGTTAGGIAGFNTGTVVESYVTGEVTGDEPVGGIVGVHKGILARSYSTADVTGNRTVGGLVGMAHAEPTGIAPGTRPDVEFALLKSYAAGDVDGERRVGGVVGLMSLRPADPRVVNDSVYWDTEATGQYDGVGEYGGSADGVAGMGLSTSEMTGEAARNSMRGFDFDSAWMTSNAYPKLTQLNESSEVDIYKPERVPRRDGENGTDGGRSEEENHERLPGFTSVAALIAAVTVAWWSYET